MARYIYQIADWPHFIWDNQTIFTLLGKVRNLQGRLIGKMETLGFHLRDEASLETLTLEITKSTEIEGEILNPEQVRSSIARRLGMDLAGLIPSDREVDGVVEMVLDAIQHYQNPLTKERLFDWHFSLFPSGRSGMYKIQVGSWRKDTTGPMQVVSGPMGREQVHFQAPSSDIIETEMDAFLNWVNNENTMDPVIKAAIAHLWFVTIHPFDDGNGRITRAITDMLLTRSDGVSQRFYSMSAQIRKERKAYYAILEKTQKGTLDITAWLLWFLHCLLNALDVAEETLSRILKKHKFWTTNATTTFNERQIKLLNRLLDGFKGKLTSGKWAKIAKCSTDTAFRDIQDLINKGILIKDPLAGGRSTNYILKEIE
jgi:Fic family protein